MALAYWTIRLFYIKRKWPAIISFQTRGGVVLECVPTSPIKTHTPKTKRVTLRNKGRAFDTFHASAIWPYESINTDRDRDRYRLAVIIKKKRFLQFHSFNSMGTLYTARVIREIFQLWLALLLIDNNTSRQKNKKFCNRKLNSIIVS